MPSLYDICHLFLGQLERPVAELARFAMPVTIQVALLLEPSAAQWNIDFDCSLCSWEDLCPILKGFASVDFERCRRESGI